MRTVFSHFSKRYRLIFATPALLLLSVCFSSNASALYCDTIGAPLPSWISNEVAANKGFYVAASNATGVPWEMLAAIHYRETSFSHSNPSNGQGIFQFVNGDGGPYSPGPVSDENFQKQLNYMASRIQSDYVYRGSLNYSHRPLRQNEPDAYRVQDTLYSYNGRAGVYAQQASQYGFNTDTSPYEGSPYVMNKFDCPRYSMGMISRDYGSLDANDTRYGAFTLYARLKGDSYWKSLPNWLGLSPTRETVITSRAHIGGLGWTSSVTNNAMIGTTGKTMSMEAFLLAGPVEYSSYSNITGWQPAVTNGMTSGTVGLGRSIQAFKISLTGSAASKYDIYYRAHVGFYGWMEWTKNGQATGIIGNPANSIEAIDIQLVPAGWPAPYSSGSAFVNTGQVTPSQKPVSLNLRSHVSGIGWQPYVTDSMTSGTFEQNRRIEAIDSTVSNTQGLTGWVSYSTHLAGIGWQDFVSNGAIAGTVGQSRQIEAIRMTLTGDLYNNYDLWYRTFVKGIGWQAWTKDAHPSGSVGASLGIEAIDTRITPKGSSGGLTDSPGMYNPTGQSLPDSYSLSYSTHLSNIGWLNNVSQNQVGGTTGQSRAIEAIRFDSLRSQFGEDITINCTYVSRGLNISQPVGTGAVCGTTGQFKPLEAIKLSLSGQAAKRYDLLYKAHVSQIGWTDWCRDGEIVGLQGTGKQIEAITVKLVLK